MWNKQTETELPNARAAQGSGLGTTPSMTAPTARPSAPTARNMSCLGSSIQIKGQITGEEDLQIDGKIEGPISLRGQKLTVGHTGQLNSEVSAREVIVHGNITGNLAVQDRVEIKRDASVVGDVKASRISIEDGAHFKGRIEIERGKPVAAEEPQAVTALVGVAN